MELPKQPSEGSETNEKYLVSKEDIKAVLCLFASENYTAATTNAEYELCLQRCAELMKLDYNVIEVSNAEGSLCFQYPSTILVPNSEKNGKTNDKSDENNHPGVPNDKKTHDLFKKAQYARCRQRFPVPVILFQGKYICRSATLASVPEVCYRVGARDIGMDSLWSLKEFLWPEESTNEVEETDIKETTEQKVPAHWQLTENMRSKDIELLEHFQVNTIFDLMVEKRKIKHGLFVSSSEKVNREKYSEFKLCIAPYPGCEFFKKYSKTMFKATNLYFDWAHPQCDIELSIPPITQLNINWEAYKTWDLITMTKNYITYILKTLEEDSTGILVHCISGWDRTPLFISLLRIILWAEGHIHKSLNAMQILYVTLVYDWMLFGHCLQNRLAKHEEIMYFCFGVLKFFIGNYIVKLKGKTPLEIEKELMNAFEDESSEDELDDDEFVIVEDQDVPLDIPDDADNKNVDPCQEATADGDETPSVSASATPVCDEPIREPTMADQDAWATVTKWGSVRKDSNIRLNTKRDQRLNAVRRQFIEAYFKTIKKDSYGPAKRSPIESVIVSLAEFVNAYMPS